MTRALVLGGGGLTGIAWEAGVLRGLRDAGHPIDEWDRVIGTSAGAFVGARMLGDGLDSLYAEQAADDTSEEETLVRELAGRFGRLALVAARRRRLRWIPRLWIASVIVPALVAARLGRRRLADLDAPAITGGAPDPMLARIGRIALHARTAPEDVWRRVVATFLGPVTAFPERLIVTAIDAVDGSVVMFDAGSGTTLEAAVAASGALPGVFPPVTIAGRPYIDGGMRSDTNCHLAAGHDEVLVLAPLGRAALEGEITLLKDAGAAVTVIRPGAESRAVLGSEMGLLDPARRVRSVRAGYDEGLAAARRLGRSRAA